jgi:hypothetical protein
MRRFSRSTPAIAIARCLVVAVFALPCPGTAQQPADTAAQHLSTIARSAVDVYNSPATRRVTGAYDVPAATVVRGDVAVLNGPVTIAGRIEGSLIAINADVRFAPGARVDQQLIVIGGGVSGDENAHIGGEIQRQVELLRYHPDGERIVVENEPVYDDSWWQRHHLKHAFRHGEAYTDFFYVASRAYNRVEGWSIVVGPRFQRAPSWGEINVEAFGVIRTADPVTWGDQTLGHDASAEIQFGKPIGVAVGGHLFDAVAPTESWQMADGEVGLASVIMHRDYRDYYSRHGGELFLRLQGGKDADLTMTFSDEQWGDRRDRDPWTLFRGNSEWRPNPQMDVGAMHLLTTRLRIDTREREGSPLAGWYLTVELENGAGRLTRLGAQDVELLAPHTMPFLPRTPEAVEYARGFLDLRRFNRISPNTSLNLRLIAGGWLNGDALPTERRLSVGGPGTIPGYAFREIIGSPDVMQCSAVVQSGSPGQCDRIALAQIELRSRFLAGVLRDDGPDDWWRPGLNHHVDWVLFADAGRGWLVGTPNTTLNTGALTYGSGTLPPFDTFKTDIGLGLDFGGIGAYFTKAVADSSEPVRFFLRLQRRF